MRRKDASLETLRGIAIILMVAGHVIGVDATRGLRVDDDSGWRYFYSALEDLRLPMFTVLSGYVYSLRPFAGGSLGPFVKGKTRRLLVPLISVGIVLFCLQLVVPEANQKPQPQDFYRIVVYSFQHLWFLQAIFTIFVVVALLEKRGVLDSVRGWVAVTAVAGLLNVLVRVPADLAFFALNGTLRLFVFFLIGLGLHRFGGEVRVRRLLPLILVAFTAIYATRLTLLLSDEQLSADQTRLLSFLVGAGGVLVLFGVRHRITNKRLAWLGGYAFGIYLLHPMPAAAGRIAMEHAGIAADAVLFPLILVCGLLGPVVFEVTLGRNTLISRLFLGVRPPDSRRSAPASSPPVLERV